MAVREGKGKEVGLEQVLIERQGLDKQTKREPRQSTLKRHIPASGFFRSIV